MPVVIHLYTRHPEYGREDVEVFLEEVLPAAPTVPVQVAHLGGGGGYGEATEGAVLERIREINDGVARAVRKLGPDRVVYGTDWPAISVAGYQEGILKALPLEDDELRDLMDDAAPYLP